MPEITTTRIQREQIQDLKEAQSKMRTMATTAKKSIGLLKKGKKLYSKSGKEEGNQTHGTTTVDENMRVKVGR